MKPTCAGSARETRLCTTEENSSGQQHELDEFSHDSDSSHSRYVNVSMLSPFSSPTNAGVRSKLLLHSRPQLPGSPPETQFKDFIVSMRTEVQQVTQKLESLHTVLQTKEQENVEMRLTISKLEQTLQSEQENKPTCAQCRLL